MDWLSMLERAWENHFTAAEKYLHENGNLDIPATYRDASGFLLGKWIRDTRAKKSQLKSFSANGNQIERLNSIGMVWDSGNEQSTDSIKTISPTKQINEGKRAIG